MLKSTLLDIIRTLSAPELNKFDDFLRSPYFNKKESINFLFKEIKRFAPEFRSEELDRKKVWVVLFQEKEFNYGVMKNMIYELSKLAEKFITLEAYSSKELQMFNDLTEELERRNIEKVLSTKLLSFDKYYTLAKARKSETPVQDYYLSLSKIYWQKIISNNTNSIDSGLETESKIASNYMVFSFLIYLFKVYDNLRVLKYQENKADDSYTAELLLELIGNEGIEKIISHAKSVSEQDFRVLSCYYSMYRSVSSDYNADLYFSFKESVSNISDLITRNDLRNLTINLANAMANLKAWDVSKEKEFKDIFNFMISNNIFVESNGIVSDNIFNNFIINQCSLLSHEKIEEFISKYIEKLPADKKDNSFNFAMAHLEFVKGDFKKSLEYIARINFVYFDMKYYVKNLQMMNYYELDDYEAFILAFDSYKHFTSNNRNVPELWKIKTSAFYNTANQLFRLRRKFDEFEYLTLKKQITESLPSRKIWLLSKLEELSNQVRS